MAVFWGTDHRQGSSILDGLDSADARGAAHDAQSSARAMEVRLDRALMACEAMWTILRDKLGVTEEEFVTRMNEIDLQDGHLDGKVRRTAVTCPKCSRIISPRFPRCMYCGEMIVHEPFA